MTEHFTIDTARALGGPAWLERHRTEAAELVPGLEWPTAAEELWRYSRIDDLDLAKFRPADSEVLGPPGSEHAPGGGPWAAEAGSHAGMAVVHNGRVVHLELRPEVAAAGVRLDDVAESADGVVSDSFGRAAAESPDAFTTLHDAYVPGGVAVVVPDGVRVEDPILVVHWCEGDGLATFPHTLVRAGANSEVTVLDRFGSPETEHLVDAVADLQVDDGANVSYLSVQQHGSRTWHVGLQRARLGADASLNAATVALGGYYARQRSESLLAGAGAESNLLAVYFGDRHQMLDFRTLQDHDAPKTRSDLLFKGAVEDEATSVYSGLVRLREAAQRAEAYQTNRNLVLSDGASAESIPNLEIEANEVRCSHASTVGPVDDDQLYYLESRGVPREDAERLIVLGFFDDVLQRLPVGSLTTGLRRAVVDKLEHRTGADAHSGVRS